MQKILLSFLLLFSLSSVSYAGVDVCEQQTVASMRAASGITIATVISNKAYLVTRNSFNSYTMKTNGTYYGVGVDLIFAQSSTSSCYRSLTWNFDQVQLRSNFLGYLGAINSSVMPVESYSIIPIREIPFDTTYPLYIDKLVQMGGFYTDAQLNDSSALGGSPFNVSTYANAHASDAPVFTNTTGSSTSTGTGTMKYTKFNTLKGALSATFPFSLLTSISSYLSVIVSPPVAPSFTLPLGGTTMTFDLSMFDPIATAIRWLLSLMILVGCAFGVIRFYRGVS